MRLLFKPENERQQCSVGICYKHLQLTKYGSSVAGGLPHIKIANEPEEMWYLPTVLDASIISSRQSNSEILIESSVTLFLCRHPKHESQYDPGISILLNALSTLSSSIYFRIERYLGYDPELKKHSFHVRSVAMNAVGSDGAFCGDKGVMNQQFNFRSYSEHINGIISK